MCLYNGNGAVHQINRVFRPYLLHATAVAGPSSDRAGSPELKQDPDTSEENIGSVMQSLESLPESSTESVAEESKSHEAPHPDERQVGLDTDRSFVMYPAGTPNLTQYSIHSWTLDSRNESLALIIDNGLQRSTRKSQLHNLIVAILRKRRKLSYFQVGRDSHRALPRKCSPVPNLHTSTLV